MSSFLIRDSRPSSPRLALPSTQNAVSPFSDHFPALPRLSITDHRLPPPAFLPVRPRSAVPPAPIPTLWLPASHYPVDSLASKSQPRLVLGSRATHGSTLCRLSPSLSRPLAFACGVVRTPWPFWSHGLLDTRTFHFPFYSLYLMDTVAPTRSVARRSYGLSHLPLDFSDSRP